MIQAATTRDLPAVRALLDRLQLPLAGDVGAEEPASRDELPAAFRAPLRLERGQIVHGPDQLFDVHVAEPLGERAVEVLEHRPPS